jgi:uncharacterized protein YukE
MTALIELKASLAKTIASSSTELLSFDSVFDEDKFDAKNEQWVIMKDEIESLEMKLMSLMIEHQGEGHYTETDNFTDIAEKITLFHEKEATIHNEIQEMTQAREQLYDKWKREYLENARIFSDTQTKLRKVNDIDNALSKLRRNNIKANNNILLLVYIHSQVNTLLSIAGISKEKSPYKAFQVAWHNRLVDDKTYEYLKP